MSVIYKKFGDLNKAADAAIAQVVKESAIMMTAQVKELAPVDTSQLKNSYMWKAGSEHGGNTEGEDITVTPRNKHEAYVGANVEHALYQEYGTKHQKAQPHLRPAAEIIKGGNKQKIIAEAADDVFNHSVMDTGEVDKRWQ